MAITLGMEVALGVGADVNSLPLALSRPGTVTFGVALSATPCEVAWYNGQLSTDIPETQLDEITFATDAEGFMGKVVKFTELASPEYYGTVERVYIRQRNSDGDFATYVLIRTKNGQTIEALYTAVQIVTGQ